MAFYPNDEEYKEIMLKESNVPEKYKYRYFSQLKFTDKNARITAELIKSYIANFLDHFKAGRSVIMLGKPGTGKTLMGCMMIMDIIAKYGCSGRYVTVSHIANVIWKTFNGGDGSEMDVIRHYVSMDILVIDEVGRQYGSTSEKKYVFDIINERNNRNKPTVVISNCNKKELIDYIGESTFDRLQENEGIVLKFDWGSHRSQSNNSLKIQNNEKIVQLNC